MDPRIKKRGPDTGDVTLLDTDGKLEAMLRVLEGSTPRVALPGSRLATKEPPKRMVTIFYVQLFTLRRWIRADTRRNFFGRITRRAKDVRSVPRRQGP